MSEASARALRHAVCQPNGKCRVYPPDPIVVALVKAAAEGTWPVPARMALAQLGRCRKCCQYVRGICRHNQGEATDCQQRRVWLRRLLTTGCLIG